MKINDEHNHHKKAGDNLLFVFFANLCFNIIVIIGGFLTNSMAIIADSMHDLSDTIAIGIAWILERVSQKDPSDKYTYGYKRYSVIGAVITSSFVIFISFFVIYEAIGRILSPVTPDGEGMLILAVIGIIFKGIAVWRLHGAETFNEKAISFHLLSDIFEWIAILILALLVIFWDVSFLDPFVSIAVSLWLLYNIGKTFLESWRVLIQKIPSNIDVDQLKTEILAVNHVLNIESFHLWSLDGIDSVLTLKLSIDDFENTGEIKNNIRNLSSKYHITDITIEII